MCFAQCRPTFHRPEPVSGADSFTNWGNDFIGNFSGNGLVSGFPWPALPSRPRATPSYAADEFQPHHGHTANERQLQVGDIVRVSGAGGGGWRMRTKPQDWRNLF